MPPVLFPATPSGSRFVRWGIVLGGVVFFLSTLHFPAVPGTGLDETWQLLLSQGWLKGWRLGREVVFTYGPLGPLENHVQLPALYWDQVLWQVFSRAAAALLLTRMALRLPGVSGVAAVGLATLLYTANQGHNPPDPYLLLGVFAAGLTLLEETPGRRARGLALAVLTTFALLKFTLFLAAGLAVMVAMLEQLRRRQPVAALVTGGVFAAGYLILWKLLGQQWGDLPGYLRWSYAVADGYIDAMQLRPGWLALAAATFLTALTAGFILLVTRVREMPWKTWPTVLLTAGCLYLAWRHGTVRGDDSHLPGLFCATALWPLFLLAQARHPEESARLLPVAMGLALLSVGCLMRAGALETRARDFALNLAGNVAALARPEHAHERWLNEANAAMARLDRQVSNRLWPVGTTAGVYASDYAALALRPDLTPLPNLQPYAAYTPALADRDDEAFRLRSPDLMFVDLAMIDSRLAGGENMRLLARLLRDYQWQKTVGHFVVLRRNPHPSGQTSAANDPLQAVDVRFGQSLPITVGQGTPVQMEVELALTRLGRFVRFFYALPSVKLNVTTDDAGQAIPCRLTWRQAATGMVLHPFLTSNADLENWMRHGESVKVRTVSFDAVAAHWLYREPFKVTLRPLSAPVPADTP